MAVEIVFDWLGFVWKRGFRPSLLSYVSSSPLHSTDSLLLDQQPGSWTLQLKVLEAVMVELKDGEMVDLTITQRQLC
jgi:hypothetical protein